MNSNMNSLFDGKLAPLTLAIGFLECPLSAFCEAYVAWGRANSRGFRSVGQDTDLRSGLGRMLPLTIPPNRFLLFATDSPWTAYFDNSQRGPDPFTPISYFAERLCCRGLIASCFPHTWNSSRPPGVGTYGAVQFELFAPEPREFLNYERSVSVAFDGDAWRFDAAGRVQPYEELSHYSLRRIRDRFTPPVLERYCEALGVRLFDEAFYTGPGQLIEAINPVPTGAREFSLTEIRQQMALGEGT